MYEFKVKGMTCESCAGSISTFLEEIDPSGKVYVDIDDQLVHINSKGNKDDIAKVIEKAGYEVISSRVL